MQVCEAVERYGKEQQVAILAVYGGAAIRPQLLALKRGVDVIVATPGRALDHIRRKSLQLKDLQMVVLDEADEMLNMGFVSYRGHRAPSFTRPCGDSDCERTG
jgi:ATP-dependent RNA helicase DeaD